jgi:hypothetical protein
MRAAGRRSAPVGPLGPGTFLLGRKKFEKNYKKLNKFKLNLKKN